MHTMSSAVKGPIFSQWHGLKSKKAANPSPFSMKTPEAPHAKDTARKAVECKISYKEADKLARHALLDAPLENKQEILANVQKPEDILLTNLATARLLSVLQHGATEEEQRQHQVKALFLWDTVGQRVVNETLKTWQDKVNCLKAIIKSLPEELASLKRPKTPFEASDLPLNKQEALQLAEHILRKKPLENADELINKVKTSNDLLQLDRAATKVLGKMNANQPEAKVRANNLQYLFLMHRVGVQVTHTLLSCPKDFIQYAQHMLGGLNQIITPIISGW